jgi:hypothetical protein
MQCCLLVSHYAGSLCSELQHETAAKQAESMYAHIQYFVMTVTYPAACIRTRSGTFWLALGQATMATEPRVLASGRTKALQDLTNTNHSQCVAGCYSTYVPVGPSVRH